jgi:hypothetical protein
MKSTELGKSAPFSVLCLFLLAMSCTDAGAASPTDSIPGAHVANDDSAVGCSNKCDGGLSDGGLSDTGPGDTGPGDTGPGNTRLSDAGPSDAGLSEGGLGGGVKGCPSEALYGWSKNLWPDPTKIPVCFWDEDPSSESAKLIRSIVTEQYGKAGLGFSGWGRCGTADPCAIKVSLHSISSGLADVGRTCWSNEWSTGFPGGAANIRYYALHEFGHNLGMSGDFDQSKCTSVMCNGYEYDDFGATLTECDVNTIRHAYGL